jgi:predicted Zn-ribbon and HTH transcriptional regulator
MKRNIKHKCKECGYEWFGYLENPKSCPNCKSRDWDKKQNE